MTISIDPKIWGSSAWKLLHDISFYIATTDDEKIMEKAYAFFKTLRYILPCVTCQYSFDLHLLHLPFPHQKEDTPRWVFDLHNRVNDALTKKTSHPQWETWVIQYPSEMREHHLRDIWPFLQSVVEVHPGKDMKGLEIYQKNLHTFFKLVWEFLYNMKDAYHTDTQILKNILDINTREFDEMLHSKSKLRVWITSIGKQIHSPLYDTSSIRHCNKICHGSS